MEADAAFDALPAAYALALRLRAAGHDAAAVAEAVDVPVDAVDALLWLGEAKLARLVDGDGGCSYGCQAAFS
jgi:DNA-directed RNA polymerase specialized sigma24 family protein